jgi:hypothetical protein
MKFKIHSLTILALCATLTFSSCATILGGKITTAQKTKPAPGQPQRQVRAGYLIADIIFGLIPLAVDFGTAAIYKPKAGGAGNGEDQKSTGAGNGQ